DGERGGGMGRAAGGDQADRRGRGPRPRRPQETGGKAMTEHTVGTREEWLAARKELLAREKAHTRQGDELARQRRELPWVRVEKEYEFETDEGKKTLTQLFDGRRQLLVYHFMFGPEYEAGCPSRPSNADGLHGLHVHPATRANVTCLAVSVPPAA